MIAQFRKIQNLNEGKLRGDSKPHIDAATGDSAMLREVGKRCDTLRSCCERQDPAERPIAVALDHIYLDVSSKMESMYKFSFRNQNYTMF